MRRRDLSMRSSSDGNPQRDDVDEGVDEGVDVGVNDVDEGVDDVDHQFDRREQVVRICV
jgi:hypothetical protein